MSFSIATKKIAGISTCVFFCWGHTKAMGNTQHYSSVIVGGGIAGVYLSTKIEDALLLEAQPWLGGRIRTMYDETKKKVLLEQGPWRVHESHARMRTLIKKYNLHLTETSSSLAGGGSAFDAIVLKEGIARAREVEQDTGYVLSLIHISEPTRPY